MRRSHGDLPQGSDRDRDSWRPSESVAIRWTTLADDAGDFLHDLVIASPDPVDETLRKRLSITVGADGANGWALIRQVAEPITTLLVEVAESPPQRPEVVATLLDHCPAFDAGRPLRRTATRFGPADVAELAAYVMEAPSRMLPVLVLADPVPTRSAFDPDSLADLLVGVAHVVRVAADALDEMRMQFGAPFAVEAGGARLYWPKWRSDDSPSRHPRWSSEDLAAGGARPVFGRSIASKLFVVAATHVAEPPLRNRLRSAQAQAQREERDARVREQLVTLEQTSTADDGPGLRATRGDVATATADDADGARARETALRHEAERLRNEIGILRGDLDMVHDDYDAAVDELGDLERQLATVTEERDRLFAGLVNPGAPGSDPRDPKSLADAVEMARMHSTDTIYLPDALASSRRSQVRNPRKALETLMTLDRVARRFRARQVRGSLDQEMRAAGLHWSGGISETAEQLHATTYAVRHRGEYVMLGPHLRIGKSLRAYCHVDKEERLIVVGHVGEHLPGKRDR
ncbi:MAG: hypothetical protein M5T61_14980 [Acidimicrobiia bacterium]|nr:hypothetical protein [Acidimicrobiia bacterium]